MYELLFRSPDGTSIGMTSEGGSVGIQYGGLSGLVGETRDETTQSSGLPGQVLESQTPAPMTGTLRLLISEGSAESALQTWVKLRKSFRRGGVLQMTTHGRKILETHVRLDGAMSSPDSDPSDEGVLKLDVPLISDEGTWWGEPRSGGSIVRVENDGDAFIFPSVRWSGAGGLVYMPSGAYFRLPAASTDRVLQLNPARAFEIKTTADLVDYDLMDSLTADVFPEGVPAGKSRSYTLPAGASLTWRVPYLDPWGI